MVIQIDTEHAHLSMATVVNCLLEYLFTSSCFDQLFDRLHAELYLERPKIKSTKEKLEMQNLLPH